MSELLFKDEAFSIVGAAIEVHRTLGSGFLEAVYQEALGMEFMSRKVPFTAQHPIKIMYKGMMLEKEYVADFVCYDQIIVELKALDALTSKEMSQLLNYLKATGLRLGILINFGSVGKLEWKRFVL